MKINDLSDTAPWRASVVADFAASELFARTFDEGMELVEETAAYLDGGGRHDAKLLSRTARWTSSQEAICISRVVNRMLSPA